jgi:hypothetical protein
MNIDTRDIGGTIANLRTRWADRDRIIREMRDLRFLETTVDMPGGMEHDQVITPIPWQLTERMVGMLTADPFTVRIPQAEQTKAADKQASTIEKWVTAALRQLCKQQDEDVLERFVESLIVDGHGCMRMLYTPQYWRGYPKRNRKDNESDKDYSRRAEEWTKGAPLPITWNWLDPLTVYPVWDEMGLAAVLEVDQRDVITIGDAKKFNMIGSEPELQELCRTHAQGGDQVEFAQLWTRDELVYCIGDQVVHRSKHRYRRVPYVYAMGQTVSSKDPARQGMAMLYPLKNIVPVLNRLLSQKASAVRLWCWPTVLVQTGLSAPAGDDAAPRVIELKPGQAIPLLPGEEVRFLTWEGNGPDIDEMISLIQGMAERAGMADSLFGVNPGGDSGYAINQLISAARVKFKPIIAHAERAMEMMISTLLDIVEYQIKQPLYVYRRGEDGGWIGLHPDDLRGYRQIEFKLNPVMPTDEYARSSKAINENRAGLRSVYSAMEQIGIEQPEDEEDRILVDRLKQSPQIQAILQEEAARRWGLLQEKRRDMPANELAQVLAQLPPALQQAIMMHLQGGQPGQPGVPGQMGMGAPGPNMAGMPNAAVMAAPGVQAAPGAPPPGAAAMPHVGPVTQPAGIATGRAPGRQMRGQEG